MLDKSVMKFGIIFPALALCCSAQTITFQASSPVATIAQGSSSPVTVGSVTTAPAGVAIVISDLEPLAWMANGNSCSPKQGSVLANATPANVVACIEPTMPAGSHYLFFGASTAGSNGYGALPLKVGSGSVSFDDSNVNLVGTTLTQDINVTASGGTHITGAVISNLQPGVGNWLSVSKNCAGSASCKTTVTANPANLASPVPGATYIGKVAFTASDNTVGDVLVQYQYEPSNSSPVTITTPSTLNGLTNQTFNVTLAASGGTGPYTWSAVGLPSGVNISSGGVLTGKVSSAGNTQATITVRDSIGNTASLQVTFAVVDQATAIPTQVFPHVAADPDGWQTDFVIMNASSSPVAFTLVFHTDSGAAMPIEGIGAVNQVTDTIPAHGTAFYRTNATGNSDGWAEVDSAVPLSGVAIFRLHAPDGNYYEASDPLSTPSLGFTTSFDSTAFAGTSGYATGLGIVNADPTQKAQLTCTLYDNAGNVLASNLTGPNLGKSAHTAFLLQDTAPFEHPSTNARGQITCTANTKVAAIALRALNRSVSSVPVITQ